MKKRLLLLIISACAALLPVRAAVNAQHSFEGQVPQFVKVNGRGTAGISTDKFKDGKSSLLFSWDGPAMLMFSDFEDIEKAMKADGGGMIIWIYNSEPVDDDLVFRFTGWRGEEIARFGFNMDFKGWRTAWIRFDDMKAPDGQYLASTPLAERNTAVAKMLVVPPKSAASGKVYLDRLSFQCSRMHDQLVPDKQMPDNNTSRRSRLWQWARLWEWEQYPEPEMPALTAAQTEELRSVEKRMDEWAATGNPGAQYTQSTLIPRAEAHMEKYGIRRLPDGSVTGAPLLSDDEFNNSLGEMRIRYIQEIVYWYALDYLYTGNTANVGKVVDAMDHALDQGFAYGSGWGLNKHYGYQVRNLYKGIWILRKELEKAGRLEDYAKVLLYWSAVQEERKPYAEHRDEILDTWNTMLDSKNIAIMLQKDDAAKYAYMKLHADWVSDSMLCSDGTLGGLKCDGTSFHHGGHYPGYSIGAFAAVGNWCHFTCGTSFAPREDARRCFKTCLMAMQDYSKTRDWGIAVCGRHPFDGAIGENDVRAYAYLALLGDLSGEGCSIDKELAGAYLALGGNDKDMVKALKKAGASATEPEEGFRTYNYGGFGIHRRKGWMLSLKGYNSDVWASEIYAKENRYGRYLSYGTAQLFTGATAKESGYQREGWDWNRYPGATTIHLDWETLDSPLPGTLMERNDSRFPGVSSLEGRNGCLAFTFTEKDRPHFCAGASATKSVFCFDNRIVFIGTGICNNSQNPTETTLYQFLLNDRDEQVDIDDDYSGAFPYMYCNNDHHKAVLTDTKGNFYILKDAAGLKVEKKSQVSPSDERKEDGKGDFITAYIDHGTAPKNASYEYLMLVKGDNSQLKAAKKGQLYKVVQGDNNAHVVKDLPTGITAYIIYGMLNAENGTLVESADAETIIMEREKAPGCVVMSICTPDLGITEKGYTTAQKSQPLERKARIRGKWSLKPVSLREGASARADCEGDWTTVTVDCIDGQPVEFELTTLN